MIRSVHIQNFKALRDVTLELTPVHVLIGPNDSGKTSILQALAALSRSTDHPLQAAFLGAWNGKDLVNHAESSRVIQFQADANVDENSLRYSLSCRFPEDGRNVVVHQEAIQSVLCPSADHQQTSVYQARRRNLTASSEMNDHCQRVHSALSGVHLYRWIPRHLALPVAPTANRRFRMDSDGFGLASLLDDILGSDRAAFDKLEAQFISIFPQFKSITFKAQDAYRSPADEPLQVPQFERAYGKGVEFELRSNAQRVAASQASDGVLLVLAYLAVLYAPARPRLLLIEEPENGIHPRRLKEVNSTLRQIVAEQSHCQVVMTTHSPYVVDLFQPEEVTLCTKNSEGAVELTRLSESKSVREQLSIFGLGEIWSAEGDEDLAKEAARAS